MKRFLVIFATVVLAACNDSDEPFQKTAHERPGIPYGVTVFYDEKHGATCWQFDNGYSGGLSCLPNIHLRH